MTRAMANGRRAEGSLRIVSLLRSALRVGIIVIALVVLALASVVAWVLFVPAVGVYGTSISPDGEWVALLENVQYGPVTGPSDDIVAIHPLDALFPLLTEKEVFKIDSVSSHDKTTVAWKSDHELVIRYPSGIPTPIKIESYGHLKIDFEAQSEQSP